MARLNRLIRCVCLIAALSLQAVIASAQGSITGTVFSGKTPVAGASVFLNNATYGTTSQADGSFTMNSIKPGQYQLVVTSIGYEQYTQTVMVGNAQLRLAINMQPKVTQLREVVIMSDADWKKAYEIFKEDFIGKSENSEKCKVMNPHAVQLSYNGSKRLLTAYTDEFFVVENRALGYRVKYLVNDFQSDRINGLIQQQGNALFEELPGSEAQKKRWKQKREEVYYGSAKHFYRSLYTDNLAADSFEVRPFRREINPQRPPEEVIQKKLKQFNGRNRDSLIYWNQLENMPKYYHERLGPPLRNDQLFAKTDSAGVYVLTGGNYLLYVIYKNRRDKVDFINVYRPITMENFETSIVTMPAPYLYFDSNGRVLNNYPLYEGTWSRAKLAEMLPLDYQPGD